MTFVSTTNWHLYTNNDNDGCKSTKEKAILMTNGEDLSIFYDYGSQCPIVHFYANLSTIMEMSASHNLSPLFIATSIIDNSNEDNLVNAQYEKLKWHQQLGHASFDQINM